METEHIIIIAILLVVIYLLNCKKENLEVNVGGTDVVASVKKASANVMETAKSQFAPILAAFK